MSYDDQASFYLAFQLVFHLVRDSNSFTLIHFSQFGQRLK
jgi:hypothetical protein